MADHSVNVIVDKDVTLDATTTGTGCLVERYAELLAILDVTAVAGTNPTLDVAIQVSADDAVYITVQSFSQITSTGTVYKALTNFGKWVRLVYTIGGTDSPSFTVNSTITLKT